MYGACQLILCICTYVTRFTIIEWIATVFIYLRLSNDTLAIVPPYSIFIMIEQTATCASSMCFTSTINFNFLVSLVLFTA